MADILEKALGFVLGVLLYLWVHRDREESGVKIEGKIEVRKRRAKKKQERDEVDEVYSFSNESLKSSDNDLKF